ncbi:MAG: hypothetical protein Q8P42_12410 [Gallionella sp.]|nr:hypothetical protein [Gallionella sp.]
MQIKFISPASGNSPGLLRKTAAVITMVVLAGVALMFSAILLAVILIVVVFGGAYLWWKTRALRKLMKEQMRDFPPQGATMRGDAFAGEVFKGEVIEGEAIEGEAIRVAESTDQGASVDLVRAQRRSR